MPAPATGPQRPRRASERPGARAATAAEGRRTVQITGQTVPARSRQRQRPRRSRELGSNPDRLALWAVVLCLFMALVAAATARGDDRPGAAERGDGPPPPALESSR